MAEVVLLETSVAYATRMCGGNTTAGMLLDRIWFWYGKASHERDGKIWLIKSFSEFAEELGISKSAYTRAMALLREMNLIATEVHRHMFKASWRATYILVTEQGQALLDQYRDLWQGRGRKKGKAQDEPFERPRTSLSTVIHENLIVPSFSADAELGSDALEIGEEVQGRTHETVSEGSYSPKEAPLPPNPPSPIADAIVVYDPEEVSIIGKAIQKVSSMIKKSPREKLNEHRRVLQFDEVAKTSKKAPATIKNVGDLEELWIASRAKANPGLFQVGWTLKQRGIAKGLLTKVPGDLLIAALPHALAHWSAFTAYVRENTTWKNTPEIPDILFVVSTAEHLVAFQKVEAATEQKAIAPSFDTGSFLDSI